VNPIPWRDIVLYADVHELDPDVFQVFRAVIREMDAGFLSFHQTERKTKESRSTRDDE
jgi:hypothetical protein